MTTNGKSFALAHWHGPAAPDGQLTEPEHRIGVTCKQEAWECVFLAAKKHLKISVIARIVKLSPGQVRYRLAAVGLFMNELREGRGPYATLLINPARERAESREVLAIVRHKLEERQKRRLQNGNHQHPRLNH